MFIFMVSLVLLWISFSIPTLFTSYANPELFIVELGSNDLAKKMHPEIVAAKVFDVGEQLHNLNYVSGIMSVPPRTQTICMSPEKYFNKLMIFNDTLKNLCTTGNYWSAFFHKHKGFWEVESETGIKSPLAVNIWTKDGKHPNSFWGREQYKASVQFALSKRIKLLNKPGYYW